MTTIKILQKSSCLEINDVNFVHHCNGGGLKAETAEVDDNVYLGPRVMVKDKVTIKGKEIRIDGIVEIKPNVKIQGEKISIFGLSRLSIVQSFKKTDIDISGNGRWAEI